PFGRPDDRLRDEAIHSWASGDMDCFASLAMTKIPLPNSRRAIAARDFLLPIEFGATARQVVRAHLGDIVVIELPGGVLAPAQRRLHGGARAGGAFEQAEREFERQRLRVDVMRLA